MYVISFHDWNENETGCPQQGARKPAPLQALPRGEAGVRAAVRVTQLLRAARGNCSEAARIAAKDRKDFYDLMRRAGVRPRDFR